MAVNWPIPEGIAASRNTATRLTPGAICLSSLQPFRGRGGPALYRAAEAAPALRPTDFGHLQNFQRLRAPLRARLRSPRATLAETARIRHVIEINRALGRTSALSVRITYFPTV
jgi:hypothetical protein